MRREDRINTSVYATIRGRHAVDDEWQEFAEIVSLSRLGAGFRCSRKVSVGQLLVLEFPMPAELRLYDTDLEQYSVFGIVQYCTPASGADQKLFDVGVAFSGKIPPDSYIDNPSQHYRIDGTNELGFWRLVESARPFRQRKYPRFRLKLAAMISLIQHSRVAVVKENVMTLEISAGGVSFPSKLEVSVGDKVKFACKEYDFYAFAIVRNRNDDFTPDPSLHLEFIDVRFPVEKLRASGVI